MLLRLMDGVVVRHSASASLRFDILTFCRVCRAPQSTGPAAPSRTRIRFRTFAQLCVSLHPKPESVRSRSGCPAEPLQATLVLNPKPRSTPKGKPTIKPPQSTLKGVRIILLTPLESIPSAQAVSKGETDRTRQGTLTLEGLA